jgi:hypothetical protein
MFRWWIISFFFEEMADKKFTLEEKQHTNLGPQTSPGRCLI